MNYVKFLLAPLINICTAQEKLMVSYMCMYFPIFIAKVVFLRKLCYFQARFSHEMW